MTEQLEQELRRLFAEDAEKAPTSVPVVETAHRRSHRRWNTPLVWGAGALVAASVAGVALLGGRQPSTGPAEAGPATAPAVSTVPATPSEQSGGGELSAGRADAPLGGAGAVPGGAQDADCKVSSPEAVASSTEVAFDGTVTDIAPAPRSRPDSGIDVVATTLTVNEWFGGGTTESITVDIPIRSDVAPPPFEVGTRLLVSGAMRRGQSEGASVRAWECGFTRYYDEATADSWRAAFR